MWERGGGVKGSNGVVWEGRKGRDGVLREGRKGRDGVLREGKGWKGRSDVTILGLRR